MSDLAGLDVSGGADGFAARLQDIDLLAGALAVVGDDLGAAAVSVTRIMGDPDLVAAALLCPMETARVQVRLAGLTYDSRGLVMLSAMALSTGLGLRATTSAYREADRVAHDAFDAAAREAGMLLGRGFTLLGGALMTSPVGLLLVSMWGDDAMRHLEQASLAHPWLLDAATVLGPGAVEGGVSLVAGPVLTRWLFGGAEPSWSFDARLDTLVEVARLLGLFREGGAFVTRPVTSADGAVPAPESLADLMHEQVTLGDGEHDGQLTVIEVEQPDGSAAWIVQIPGTQSASPVRGDSPMDATSDALLMAGQGVSLEECVVSAMDQAGVRPGDQVMLAGHSLGGIAAASLAGSPRFRERFTVTAVVTAGSPIARIQVPPDVAVLALEHRQDVVPKADGRPNPSGSRYVTVVADAPLAAGVGAPATISRAHSAASYVGTAALVDGSTDPAIDQVRGRHRRFFTGRGSGRRFQITPSPTPPSE